MILLLALACTSDPGKTDDSAATSYLSPEEAGPFAAGTAEYLFTSSAGYDTPVQIWYPSDETSGSTHLYDDLFEGTALDAPAAACDEARPVVVFSHGNGGIRWQSIFLTERLASRGWVVVAPDHVLNTIFDDDEAAKPELVLRRPIDIADSYDWLVELASAAGGPLEGCVDPDAGYAVIGHSFGGYTTFAVAGAVLDVAATAAWCADNGGWLCDEVAAAASGGETTFDLSDPRAWAAVPMAPAGYEALVGGYADITVPVLTLGGGRDTLTPMETAVTPAYEALTGASWRALGEITDAGHYTFSDACDLLPTYADCAPPYLDPAEGHALINTLTVAFLDAQRGEAEAEAWLPPQDDRLVWTAP